MDSDKTLTAKFTLLPKLTVILAGTGKGTVASIDGRINCTNLGSVCSAPFSPLGVAAPLTATPSGSSSFASWSGACTGTDPNGCSVMLNSDQSVAATFNLTPDVTMSPSAASLRVKRGGLVSDVLTFLAQGGFSGNIALTCSVTGPAPVPTCGIARASVTPGNNATLTVNAAALSASTNRTMVRAGSETLYAAWLPLGLLGCVLATGFDMKRWRLWALCLLIIAAAILPAACGGGNSVPPPPVAQSYAVTVKATSGALQHSTTVSLTVN
jgi:hypothetical protein